VAFVDQLSLKRDFKFCEQLSQAARSAPANIAEGFGRTNRQFLNYLETAIGSFQEFENHIDEAFTHKWIGEEQHTHFRRLAKRGRVATIRLAAYLRRRNS